MTIFKTLVTGSFGAGKTTFIRQLSEIDVVSVDSIRSAKLPGAFDFGRLSADDETMLYLFATPGARRLDLAFYHSLPVLLDGIVIIVDATNLSAFGEVQHSYLAIVRQTSLPFIIAMNRWDSPEAPSQESLKATLGIRDSEQMVRCNVVKRAEVSSALVELFSLLPQDNVMRRLVTKLRSLNE